MYFYCFDKPGAPDEEIFDATYKNLKVIEEYEFPTDSQKFKKFIDTGAIRIVGRVTELGHQPILDINVNKIIKEVLGKHKASQQDLEEYFTFWFTWVKNHMMVNGKIERMFLVYDMKDVKVWDIPMGKLQGLVKVQVDLFTIGGPYRNIFVNMDWQINTIVKVVNSWFNEHTREIV
jgi:hypothetical protein